MAPSRCVYYGYPRSRLPDDLGLDDTWPDYVTVTIEEEEAETPGEPPVTRYFEWRFNRVVEIGDPLPGRSK